MTIISTDPISDERKIPFSALVLGWAGVLPFAAGALAMLIGAPPGRNALLPLLIYGAVILSFLGGVRWGMAMRLSGAERGQALAQSIVPALIGWIAACLYGFPMSALILLALAHGGLGAADIARAGRGLMPIWYGRLRLQLSASVVTSLMIALIAEARV